MKNEQNKDQKTKQKTIFENIQFNLHCAPLGIAGSGNTI